MLNKIDYIVFDFETTGLKPGYHEVIQIAGKAYDHRNLQPYSAEEGGEFMTYVKPFHWERRDAKAMEVNGITWDQLENAPEPGVAFNAFVKWVAGFNKGKSKGIRTAPIPLGKNIRDFDFEFLNLLKAEYGKKKEKTVVFNSRNLVDLQDLIFVWFEGSSQLERVGMDYLREKFGLSSEGAHDALVDVRQEGEFIMKFLRLHRRLLARRTSDGRPFIPFFPKENC